MATVNDGDLPLQRIYRWERERASEIFLTQPAGGQVRDWTWLEGVDEARRAATYLKAQNWEPGSPVAILSKNCAWWILSDLAIWMAGHVSVPVYPSLTPQTARQILEHSGTRACFLGATDEQMAGAIPPGVCTIRFPTAAADRSGSWDELIRNSLPMAESPIREAGELSTIIYTSGTTGTAKGVMHSFGAFAYNARILAEMIGLTAEQRILSYLPLAHIVERVGVESLSVFLGSRIFFTEGLDTFVADLQRAQPSIFLSVPRLMLKFQQNVFEKVPRQKLDGLFRMPIVGPLVKRKIRREMGLNDVRYAACGAAPLPVDILLWFRELGLNLVEGYGMTETLVTHLPAPGTVRPGYVGNAIGGVEQRLGEDSELQINSPMNMLGYYKDPVGTRDAFLPDGFFRTGDVCEIASDGQLKIVGRIKEQFKTSKGKYVAPVPIESKLIAHSDIEACCLMGAGMASPFAVALLSDAARERCADPIARTALEESLRSLLVDVNANLDPHERVAFIAVANGPWTIGNGLMTPTLKLKRPVLERRYQELVDSWRASNRPVVWESAP